MSRVRVLLDHDGVADPDRTPDQAAFRAIYRPPPGPWLRAMMLTTLDGAVAGSDGRSGSLNNEVDHRVFAIVREFADAILVGAGTARIENYGPASVPLIVVSRTGILPARLTEESVANPGLVWLATCAAAPGLSAARDRLGADQVLVCGEDEVHPRYLVEALRARGLQQLVCEGGPTLLGSLAEQDLVDEWCLTTVPILGGVTSGRLATGTIRRHDLALHSLIECDGTLLARWVRAPVDKILRY